MTDGYNRPVRPRVLACRSCLDLQIGHVDDACPCGRGLLVVPDGHYYAKLRARDAQRFHASDTPIRWVAIAIMGMVTGAVVAWLLG